jgi:hypothetical protein
MSLFPEATTEKIIGEATAIYYACPWVPRRIHDWFPGAKMVLILRNPIERAWSHYRKHARSGYPMFSASFEEALREVHVHRLSDGSMTWHEGYIPYGMYAQCLSRYSTFFGSDQLKVVLFEDLKRQPENTLKILHDFLGLDPHVPSDLEKVYNASESQTRSITGIRSLLGWAYRRVSGHTCPTPNMPSKIRQHLISLFEEDIRKTQDLIGRDLHHWLV